MAVRTLASSTEKATGVPARSCIWFTDRSQSASCAHILSTKGRSAERSVVFLMTTLSSVVHARSRRSS